jgi:hypothetical protein
MISRHHVIFLFIFKLKFDPLPSLPDKNGELKSIPQALKKPVSPTEFIEQVSVRFGLKPTV